MFRNYVFFANEFGALFCVSFHPEIDPICLNQQKEELLDLKRQRADTETRERACNICLTSETKGLWHLSQSLFAPCFLRLSFKAIMRGGGGSCNFDAHCYHYLCSMATRMPPDDGWWLCRGLFKSMKSRPQKLCCREICRQTGTGAARHNPNVTSDSDRQTPF